MLIGILYLETNKNLPYQPLSEGGNSIFSILKATCNYAFWKPQ